MTGEGERFTIELPGDPAYLATARLFASTLARHFDVADDVIEDLKLAIGEACSRLLATVEPEPRLALRAERVDGRLVFEVPQGDLREPVPSETPTPSAEELAAGLSLELVGALFEDTELAEGEAGARVLRFSVPLGSSLSD